MILIDLQLQICFNYLLMIKLSHLIVGNAPVAFRKWAPYSIGMPQGAFPTMIFNRFAVSKLDF